MRFVIFFSMITIVMGTEEVVKEGQIQCWYCGITDNCRIPYDTEADVAMKIPCDKSCVKFDGTARDGKRVVIRNCGYFQADECVEGAFFEDSDTVGTICHCLEDSCNSSNSNRLNLWVLIINIVTLLYFGKLSRTLIETTTAFV